MVIVSQFVFVFLSLRVALPCCTGFGNIGIDQRPFFSCLPMMIILFCLAILTSCLVKRAIQSSSHNWDNDISVPVSRSSRTIAAWAHGEGVSES